MRTLEDKNRRLMKLLAGSMLDVSVLKDLLEKSDPVGGSLRCGGEADDRPWLLRASHLAKLVGVNRSAWQYEPLRGKDDAVRVPVREIANERRRFGYRWLAICSSAKAIARS